MVDRRRFTSIIVVILMSTALVIAYGYHSASQTNSITRNSNPSLSVQTVSTLTEPGVGFLSVNGTQFVDQSGNIVIFRGVNLSGYEYAPPEWIHNSSDFETIADWGFNVVRLPISWENIEPKPSYYNESYLRLVDQDLAWAKQYGIYVVLDMHEICWSTEFASCNSGHSAGIPKWAVGAYADSVQGIRRMLHDFYMGLGPNATSPTPTNPSVEARFFAVWKYVASRYANQTIIAAYDVLNEPTQQFQELDYNVTFTSQILPSFYTNAIEAIRTVDHNHICFWEGPTSVSVNLPNVAYSPHYPQGSVTSYNRLNFLKEMSHLLALSNEWQVPLFIGEWGMYADSANIVQYIGDSLTVFDYNSISSAWWDYSRGSFPMDLFNPQGQARHVLVDNLVRPFLRWSSTKVNVVTIFNVTAPFYTQTIRIQTEGSSSWGTFAISIPTKFWLETNASVSTGSIVNLQFFSQGKILVISVSPQTTQVSLEYASA